MNTQAQTLQRLEALAQWEQDCVYGGDGKCQNQYGDRVPCVFCNGTGKVPVLPELRKLCPGMQAYLGQDPTTYQCLVIFNHLPDSRTPKDCVCRGRGWVLRGNLDTKDGRLLFFGALQQALLKLVDEVKIGRWSPIPEFHVELSHEGGHCWVKARGPTALEALVDAATKLKQAQP